MFENEREAPRQRSQADRKLREMNSLEKPFVQNERPRSDATANEECVQARAMRKARVFVSCGGTVGVSFDDITSPHHVQRRGARSPGQGQSPARFVANRWKPRRRNEF